MKQTGRKLNPKWRSSLAFVLCLIMVLSTMTIMAGCGGETAKQEGSASDANASKANSATTAIDDEVQTEPVKFVVRGINDIENKSANEAVYQKIREASGVDFEVIVIPTDSWAEKVNLMIATGDEWDVLNITESAGNWNQFYQKNALQSWDEYMDYIQIQFDGVATHATVWVNGHLVYRNFCGYTSFCVDITEFVEYGELLNEISVYVDTKDFEAWWYEGAGIYRHVRMIKTAPISVDNWGSFVDARHQKDGSWLVNVENDIRNILFVQQDVAVRCTIIDANGEKITTTEVVFTALPREATKVKLVLNVNNPKLWSVDEPNLYAAESIGKDAFLRKANHLGNRGGSCGENDNGIAGRILILGGKLSGCLSCGKAGAEIGYFEAGKCSFFAPHFHIITFFLSFSLSGFYRVGFMLFLD